MSDGGVPGVDRYERAVAALDVEGLERELAFARGFGIDTPEAAAWLAALERREAAEEEATYVYSVKADVLIYLARPLDAMTVEERAGAVSENVEEAVRAMVEDGHEDVEVELVQVTR